MKPIALLLKPHHHPDELSVLPTATVYSALVLLASKWVSALMVMDDVVSDHEQTISHLESYINS